MKSLETRQAEVGNAIDASTNALLDAEDKIGKAKEMIRKANLLLSRAEPVRLEETTRLEQLKAQSDELSRQELVQRATLAEVEARLAQVTNFNEAELSRRRLSGLLMIGGRGWLPLKSGSDLIMYARMS